MLEIAVALIVAVALVAARWLIGTKISPNNAAPVAPPPRGRSTVTAAPKTIIVASNVEARITATEASLHRRDESAALALKQAPTCDGVATAAVGEAGAFVPSITSIPPADRENALSQASRESLCSWERLDVVPTSGDPRSCIFQFGAGVVTVSKRLHVLTDEGGTEIGSSALNSPNCRILGTLDPAALCAFYVECDRKEHRNGPTVLLSDLDELADRRAVPLELMATLSETQRRAMALGGTTTAGVTSTALQEKSGSRSGETAVAQATTTPSPPLAGFRIGLLLAIRVQQEPAKQDTTTAASNAPQPPTTGPEVMNSAAARSHLFREPGQDWTTALLLFPSRDARLLFIEELLYARSTEVEADRLLVNSRISWQAYLASRRLSQGCPSLVEALVNRSVRALPPSSWELAWRRILSPYLDGIRVEVAGMSLVATSLVSLRLLDGVDPYPRLIHVVESLVDSGVKRARAEGQRAASGLSGVAPQLQAVGSAAAVPRVAADAALGSRPATPTPSSQQNGAPLAGGKHPQTRGPFERGANGTLSVDALCLHAGLLAQLRCALGPASHPLVVFDMDVRLVDIAWYLRATIHQPPSDVIVLKPLPAMSSSSSAGPAGADAKLPTTTGSGSRPAFIVPQGGLPSYHLSVDLSKNLSVPSALSLRAVGIQSALKDALAHRITSAFSSHATHRLSIGGLLPKQECAPPTARTVVVMKPTPAMIDEQCRKVRKKMYPVLAAQQRLELLQHELMVADDLKHAYLRESGKLLQDATALAANQREVEARLAAYSRALDERARELDVAHREVEQKRQRWMFAVADARADDRLARYVEVEPQDAVSIAATPLSSSPRASMFWTRGKAGQRPSTIPAGTPSHNVPSLPAMGSPDVCADGAHGVSGDPDSSETQARESQTHKGSERVEVDLEGAPPFAANSEPEPAASSVLDGAVVPPLSLPLLVSPDRTGLGADEGDRGTKAVELRNDTPRVSGRGTSAVRTPSTLLRVASTTSTTTSSRVVQLSLRLPLEAATAHWLQLKLEGSHQSNSGATRAIGHTVSDPTVDRAASAEVLQSIGAFPPAESVVERELMESLVMDASFALKVPRSSVTVTSLAVEASPSRQHVDLCATIEATVFSVFDDAAVVSNWSALSLRETASSLALWEVTSPRESRPHRSTTTRTSPDAVPPRIDDSDSFTTDPQGTVVGECSAPATPADLYASSTPATPIEQASGERLSLNRSGGERQATLSTGAFSRGSSTRLERLRRLKEEANAKLEAMRSNRSAVSTLLQDAHDRYQRRLLQQPLPQSTSLGSEVIKVDYLSKEGDGGVGDASLRQLLALECEEAAARSEIFVDGLAAYRRFEGEHLKECGRPQEQVSKEVGEPDVPPGALDVEGGGSASPSLSGDELHRAVLNDESFLRFQSTTVEETQRARLLSQHLAELQHVFGKQQRRLISDERVERIRVSHLEASSRVTVARYQQRSLHIGNGSSAEHIAPPAQQQAFGQDTLVDSRALVLEDSTGAVPT